MSQSSTVRFLGFEDSAVAAVTTTHGGHSEGRYATLNTSYRVGDDPSRVTANLDLAGRALDIKRSALVIPQLAHGRDVAIVTSADAGRGAYDAESNIPSTDALVTDVPGLPLAVLVADCAPVLLHDPRRGVVGVAHAGWRGAALRVVAATIEVMARQYGTNPADLCVGVGPCIGWMSFEMGHVEAAVCQEAFPSRSDIVADRDGRPVVNLRAMILAQLVEAGVPPERVHNLEDDTLVSASFFSHRRARTEGFETSGRFMGVVQLT